MNRLIKGLLGCGLSLLVTACMQTQYYDDAEVVKQTYVHKYGVPVAAQDWSERGEDGKVIQSMKNGVIATKSYEHGILNGDATYTFPHSNIIEKCETYANNVLQKEKTFYLSGPPLQEILYLPEGGKKVVSWYESGVPRSVEQYDLKDCLVQGHYYDTQHQTDSWVDEREGMRVMRDAYGQLVSRDTIKEGIMVHRTTYHANGAIKNITPYNNGVVEGIRKSFLPAGEPESIEEWVAGKQTGMTIVYQNGEKAAEIAYVNGMKNGLERRFRNGTTVTEEIHWKDNMRHGLTLSFVEGMNKSQWFFEGTPVSKGNFEILNRSSMDTGLAK